MKLANFFKVLSVFLPLIAFSNSPGFEMAAQKVPDEFSGIVIDDTGEPVIGVAIVQQGTGNGVITDIDGKFSMKLQKGQRKIKVSCIGYKEQVIELGKKSYLKIRLEVEAYMMDEVSVVAYGVQKKETVTGAISSVGTSQLLKSPHTSIANTLAGQLSGVSTVQSSGQPGMEDPQIYVRGVGTLTDASPLVLVDGIEMPFFQMDPNEIENITVLKDASATAVFGVRGANGVILVTTRRGSEGKAKISVSSSVGVSRFTRMYEMCNSYDTMVRYNEMCINDGKDLEDLPYQPFVLDMIKYKKDPLMFPDTDWKDYLFKDLAVQTQHNVNISGGTDKARYFVSLAYLYQDGQVKDLPGLNYDPNFSYNRYNYRANLDLDLTKTTKMKMSIGGYVGLRHEPTKNGSNFWTTLTQAQPFSSPGYVDGYLYKNNPLYFGNMNIVSGMDMFYNGGFKDTTNNMLNMNIELEQKLDFITEGLSIKLKGAYNTNYNFNKVRWVSTEYIAPAYMGSYDGSGLNPGDEGFDDTIMRRIVGKTSLSSYYENYGKGRDWYIEGSINYSRSFKSKHNVSALLLYNQSKRYYVWPFPAQPSGYVGVVGRITYNYMTRYMFEFNAGYNGSENFDISKRYGFFPAVSASWIMTQEPWCKPNDILSYIKFRASLGMVGNDNMSGNRYLYLDSTFYLKDSGYNFGVDIPEDAHVAREGKLGNKNVTWEKALKQNYGIDLAFFKWKLSISADYFREYRNDILISRNIIPISTGLNSSLMPVVNMGEVRNSGFELQVKWNQKVRDFSYNISTNVSYSKNKILYMDEVKHNNPMMDQTGRSIGAIYGYVADGFYSVDDFDADGNLVEGIPDPGVKVAPGDVKYKDLTNDNKITFDDQKQIGYSHRPELTYGINLGLNWKGLDLTLNFTGVGNRSVVLADEFRYPFGPTGNLALMKFMAEERWTPEKAETAKAPRFSLNSKSNNYDKISSLWVRDASYFRLKSARIGYTIPKGKFTKTLGIENLNLYLAGYNLFTIDKLKLMDPEANASRNSNTYPITQTFTFGVNINF